MWRIPLSCSEFEMKRKDEAPRSIRVRSLSELDALVGKYLTGETPCVHWVNNNTEFQFNSVEEAVEAVNDPFYRQLVEHDEPGTTVLMEVREFRRYSTDLAIAWELVWHLSHRLEPLLVRRNDEIWEGAFGSRDFVSAPTAAVAICLAALRARGIEVECQIEPAPGNPAAGLPDAKVNSLYARE